MSRKKDEAGTFALLARLPQQLIALAKAELANAKREIAAKAKRAGIGAAAIVVALFFLFWAVACLVAAAVAGFATFLPVWLSALIVAFSLLLFAVGAIVAGIALIKRGVPIPEETIDRVEEDFEALGEVRFNASARTPQAGEKGNWR